jgi:hypothetical protein
VKQFPIRSIFYFGKFDSLLWVLIFLIMVTITDKNRCFDKSDQLKNLKSHTHLKQNFDQTKNISTKRVKQKIKRITWEPHMPRPSSQ